ncbi:MAG: SpoIID/LytB domain-containing protein [Deltaproteobacteria bacterium]|nr:SpoIID/LytB domain-containing protein [Deltaproteobacteria bacterium]
MKTGLWLGLAALMSFAAMTIACVSDGGGDDDDDLGGENVGCLPEELTVPETILVERVAQGIVQELDFEDYVKGVLPQEIGTSFPYEAIKAQAIAARTYALRWVLDGKGPICDTTLCQVYGDERYDVTDAAADDTAGQVLAYDDDIVLAVFHASSGGRTENVQDVWGSTLDYLVSVSCLENANCTGNCDDWYPVNQAPCTPGDGSCCYGRAGHGVGMSQRGAQAMATCGYLYSEILTHYYSDAQVGEDCAGG